MLRERMGNFVHGHTYSHHAVAAAAGLAVLEIVEREQLLGKVTERGLYLASLLESLKHHLRVGDVRGIGLMWAVELVKDKASHISPIPRTSPTRR